jgi:uroporphyrin-III C-methyltransferase
MSAEIESLSSEINARRTGRGASPMLVALAVLALLLAIYAHVRFSQFDGRMDRLREQVAQLRASHDRLTGQIATLNARLDTSQNALRTELRGLRELPAQLGELGRGIEELRTRTEAPQRAWVRAEALYLLDLGARRLNLEHDVVTAIVAMETADARLAMLDDPAAADVRRLLAGELAELRAVQLPDVALVLRRIAALEDAVPTLPVLGIPAGQGRRTGTEPKPDGPLERGLSRLAEALHDLVSLKRIDPATTRLVTQEEQSLRRQHLELLLFAARVAAMQPDATGYQQSLQAAATWLEQFFDVSSPAAAAAQAEIAALRGLNIAPPLPAVGAAARQLQRVMSGNPGRS